MGVNEYTADPVPAVPGAEPLMLGPPKSRDLDTPIQASLNDLVPAGHFYRHLERTLDLTFERPTRAFAAHRLIRWCSSGFSQSSSSRILRSERQLMRVVADRLSLRWYVRYNLTEPLPDHSSLTRVRERHGLGGLPPVL